MSVEKKTMKPQHILHIIYACLFLVIFVFCFHIYKVTNDTNRQITNQLNNFTTNLMKNPYNFLHKVIMKENLRKYTYVLNRIKTQKVSPNPYPHKIWFYWSESLENAPKIVRICLKSIKKHIPGMDVITLDKNSVKKYIKLPKHILKKYEDGTICEAHFSDIVRVNLLNEYGGLWLDSTVFLTGAIPEDIFSADFFAPSLCDINPKKLPDFQYKNLLLPGIFCNYFMYVANPHNYVMECMVAFLNEYWKDRTWSDYFLFYEFTAVAMEEDPQFFDIIMNMIRNHYYPETAFLNLDTKLNEQYLPTTWKQLKKFPVHKICGATYWKKRKIIKGSFAEKLVNEKLN